MPQAKGINLNKQIMDLYLQELMPGITEPGDDNNYGSAAMQDVLCLQALSKRIHYGKFVAEAKYRAHPEQYEQLIQNRDHDAIMNTLTNEDVEKKVCSMCTGGSGLSLMLCPLPCTHCCVLHNYSSCSSVVHHMIVDYELEHTPQLPGGDCHLVPCITQTCHAATLAARLNA